MRKKTEAHCTVVHNPLLAVLRSPEANRTVVATLTGSWENVCRACLLGGIWTFSQIWSSSVRLSMWLIFGLVFLLAVEIAWSVRELPVVEKPFYTHHR